MWLLDLNQGSCTKLYPKTALEASPKFKFVVIIFKTFAT